MFDPDAGMPRLNRSLVYLGACIMRRFAIAGMDCRFVLHLFVLFDKGL